MTRVGVVGAAGRMGRATLAAVAGSDEHTLTAAFDRNRVGEDAGSVASLERELGVAVTDDIDEFLSGELDAVVDFSLAEAVRRYGELIVDSGTDYVIGTTGLGEELENDLEAAAGRNPETGVLIVPNFCLGVVLMMQFAEQAAPYYDHVEITERHHTGKADSPSGTSIATADRIADANPDIDDEPPESETVEGCRGGTRENVRIHAQRLPGVVAEQEVTFGGTGETLTLEQRTTDREAFMPGVLMALDRISEFPGFNRGLETIMGLD